MCGILGFIGEGNESDAERMLERIKHRGPDDKGIISMGEVTLGHARLSILDVSPLGHQPMFDADKTIGIVFNGEMYNFKILKDDLLGKGYVFKSTSDTEVIIYLYKEYGEKCFEKLEGMFAIGLYDFTRKKLILARDRMGKKPLYYFHTNNSLVFASELKSIAAHPLCTKEIDLSSLNDYLFYDYVPTPQTMIKGVSKLEPATYLVYENNTIRKETFWKLLPGEFTGSFDEAVGKLDTLIDAGVASRLVSDVPLGVFLSGGLDSSVVAYYAQKHSSQKIKTFSVGFEEETFDESRYAQKVADYLGTDHHTFKVTHKDILDLVPKLGQLVDEPLADASILPTYLLSLHTKRQVTVALGGDGGDELFAGYPTFQAQKMLTLYQSLPKLLRQKLIEPIIRSLPVSHGNFSLGFKLNKFLDAGEDNLAHVHQNWLGSFQKEERSKLFIQSVWNQIGNDNEYESIDRYYSELNGSEENKVLYTYLRSYLMDEVMVKVDRASMYASLEARSPLLDSALVKFAFSLPYDWKLRGCTPKYIFKKCMEGKLPKEIIYRKKKGFGIPVGAWLQNELKDMVDETLSEKNVTSAGLFNYDYIAQLKSEHLSGKKDHRKKLWNLLVFELWRKGTGISN